MAFKNYLLDTNVIGYLAELKSDKKTDQIDSLSKKMKLLHPETKFFLCPITIGEIEYGMKIKKNFDVEKKKMIEQVFSSFPNLGYLNIDNRIAKENYAELRARLFDYCAPRTKKLLNKMSKWIHEWKDPTTDKELQSQENDLWIASVAMAYNLILVTNDKMNALKAVAGSDIEFESWI